MNDYAQKRLKPRFETNVNYNSTPLSEAGMEAVNKYKPIFTIRDHANYIPYKDRKQQRYTIVMEDKFKDFYGEKILDVGSRNNLLSEKSGMKCDLVDKHNKDLPPWDWEKELLPYEAQSYDTVVCLDTLEHVDNLHEAFYDLLRVSKEHVIISLPNNWKKAFNEFIKGRGRWASYGIPPEKPHDRHKWFFNTEDAEDFIYYHSAPEHGNYEVVLVQYHIPLTIPRIRITYPILRTFLPEYHFKNLFVETMFYVLKKR